MTPPDDHASADNTHADFFGPSIAGIDFKSMEEPAWRGVVVWMVNELHRSLQQGKNDTLSELKAIKLQTTTTNGRVTKLEQWRWGAVGAMTVIVAVVVPLFVDIVTAR